MRYALSCLFSACAFCAHGQTLPSGMVGADILDGWRNADDTRTTAIELTLEPEWKTYWRVPGEAGIPPELDFSQSDNVEDVQIIWPSPVAFNQEGLRSVGYTGTIILPLRITPRDASKPVELRSRLDLGLCNDICVPASLDLNHSLDGTGQSDPRILAAMHDAPRHIDNIATCSIEAIDDGMRVHARIALPGNKPSTTLFEIAGHPMWTSQTIEKRDGDFLLASTDFVPRDARPFPLDPEMLRITVLAPDGAIEINGCLTES